MLFGRHLPFRRSCRPAAQTVDILEQGGNPALPVHAFDEKSCHILPDSIGSYIQRLPAFAAQDLT